MTGVAAGGVPRVADDERLDLLGRGQPPDRRDRRPRPIGRAAGPTGRVRLLAPRTATTCCVETPLEVSLAGSRVTARRVSRPPVRSARATPSIAAISGTISLRAMVATCSSPSGLVAAIDETTTGEALMLSAWTVGVAAVGQGGLGQRVLDRRGRLGHVAPERELGHDQRDRVGRRRLDQLEARDRADGSLDRAGHLFEHVRGSCAGVRRDHGHDRELDVGEELLLEAAPGGDAGDEEGGREQERHAPLAHGQTAEATHDWLSRVSVVVTDRSMARPRMSTERPTTSSSSASSRPSSSRSWR